MGGKEEQPQQDTKTGSNHNQNEHNLPVNTEKRDKSPQSPFERKRYRSRSRSPVTSESSRQPIEKAETTPDVGNIQQDNIKNPNSATTKEKRPEWDMFADQDVDSNFDVSCWLVKINFNL